jgi:ABC-type multidrug transport system ATPase subunit
MIASASEPRPAGPAAELLRARSLGVRGAGRTLLHDLSFSVTPGLTHVRGGEGRGKSTLLRLLAGVQAPDAGTLHRGVDTVFWADPSDPRDDPLTGRQWLARPRDRFPAWDDARQDRLVEAFGLVEHLDKALFKLSTGSRRKVGLVAAFASGARVVLLDMPFAALDGPGRMLLDELLREAAGDAARAWIVADYELPATLASVPLAGTVDLGD